jgi:hypothetical protein
MFDNTSTPTDRTRLGGRKNRSLAGPGLNQQGRIQSFRVHYSSFFIKSHKQSVIIL